MNVLNNNNSVVLLRLLHLLDLFHLFANPGQDVLFLFIGKETLTLRSRQAVQGPESAEEA